MRKILAYMLCLLALGSVCGADKKELRLDSSDQGKLQESFVEMLLALDDDQQQAFATAMATIGILLNQDPEIADGKTLEELLNGKTADEIIAISRRMSPYIKQNINIINGSTAEEFGKSVGQILISLPAEKQTPFSEALAKIMYEAQKSGETEKDIIKKLDGKNADEVIKMAEKIDMPFAIGNKAKPEDYSIKTLTKEELKSLRLNEEEEPEKKFEHSLVPGANL